MMADDGFCDLLEGDLTLGGAVFPSRAGHAIDDAAGFVLGEGGGAFFAEMEQALRPVLAHAGEHSGDRVWAAPQLTADLKRMSTAGRWCHTRGPSVMRTL